MKFVCVACGISCLWCVCAGDVCGMYRWCVCGIYVQILYVCDVYVQVVCVCVACMCRWCVGGDMYMQVMCLCVRIAICFVR